MLPVAVSATTRVWDGIERVRLNRSYVRALERAGLVPLIVPPLEDKDSVENVLQSVRGLVLTGGEDIDPALYDENPHARTSATHGERDRFEIALLEGAKRLSLTTLAICRGIQVANVALGGSLVQDIPSEISGALVHDGDFARNARVHDVRVTPGSKLAGILGDPTVPVNSSHHQSVGRVADGLQVSARAPDGVIEGVEWAGDDWWMVGVQWHPEELVDTTGPWDRRLFDAFAAECALRSAQHA